MIGMTNAGGSGTGCTLTITAPAGAAITVANKAGKVKSKTVGANGLVVFRGLTEGTWTITIAKGTDTATKTVEIKADYQAEITFFSATINITYPAGLACTATNGSTTLTAPDTSGTWACVVPNKGTWTITAGDWNAEAVMTTSGQTETVRVARWIVKNGVPTDIGYSTLLVSQYPVTITPADGYLGLNNQSGGSGVVSNSKVDISAAKMIVADVDIITVTSSGNYANFRGVGLALSADKGYAYTSAANQGIKSVKLSTKTGRQTMKLDVENITGDWYVGFCLQQKNSINLYSLYAEV